HHLSAVAIAADDRQVLTVGDGEKTLRLWNAVTGKEVRRWSGHEHSPGSVAVSLDGRLALSGGQVNGLRLWDFATGKQLSQRFQGRPFYVHGVAFSADGRRALAARGGIVWKEKACEAVDCTIGVWDVETGKLLRKLEGHSNPVASAAFSPDGHRI